jgi:hypothetical protein
MPGGDVCVGGRDDSGIDVPIYRHLEPAVSMHRYIYTERERERERERE